MPSAPSHARPVHLPDWLTRNAAGTLCADGLELPTLAERFGTPLYVYSAADITRTWQRFTSAIAGRRARICYALKANSNLAIVDLLARQGAGFDIVSGGELERVLAVGGDPAHVIFSGVGKRADEILLALRHGIGCFNVESAAELDRISAIARQHGFVAPISLRVNPDVDASTHPYISTGLKENKFGVAHELAPGLYRRAQHDPHLRIVGIDCHIGSQITEVTPFLAAIDRILALVDELAAAGIVLEHIDLGGGLGIRYDDEQPPTPAAFMAEVFTRIDAWRQSRPITILFEFGRALVGNAGLLLTRTEHLKTNGDKHFAIIDAAMNDLIRPSLYQAWHGVTPVQPRSGPEQSYDLVGPVCESGDWLARDRQLCLSEGDLLAILSAGAYGAGMASNYNTRPRAAEVLILDGTAIPVRPRESVAAMLSLERRLP